MTGDPQTIAQLRGFARSLESERTTADARRRMEIDRGLASVVRGLEALGATMADESGGGEQYSQEMRAVIDALFAASAEIVDEANELAACGEDSAETVARLEQLTKDLGAVNRALRVVVDDPTGGAASH